MRIKAPMLQMRARITLLPPHPEPCLCTFINNMCSLEDRGQEKNIQLSRFQVFHIIPRLGGSKSPHLHRCAGSSQVLIQITNLPDPLLLLDSQPQ